MNTRPFKLISTILAVSLFWQQGAIATTPTITPLQVTAYGLLRPKAVEERGTPNSNFSRIIKKVVFINITEKEPTEVRPPLSVGYLANFIKKCFQDRVAIGVFDMGVQPHFEIGDIKNYVLKEKPDMVCVSVSASPLFPTSVEVTTAVKEVLPDVVTVVGGVHTSADPEGVIAHKCFDIMAIGEGELTLVNLIKAISSGADISGVKGIWFRDIKGEVVKTGEAELVDLDELSVDVLEGLPMQEYDLAMEQFAGERFLPILASRGCPFGCRFCTNATQRRPRFRSPVGMVEEIKLRISKYGVHNFAFHDDTFTFDKRWVRAFCNLVIKERLNIRWRCMTRASKIDKELMELMRRAGGVYIAFGLECADPVVLKAANKEHDLDAYRRVCEWAKDIGIRIKLFIIVGLPFETMDSINKTIGFLKEVRPEEVAVAIFVPYPGSEFAREPEKWGLQISATSLEDYLGRPVKGKPEEPLRPVVSTRWMSGDEMVAARQLVLTEFEKIKQESILSGVRQVPRQGITKVIGNSRFSSTLVIKKDDGYCMRREAYGNDEDRLIMEIKHLLALSTDKNKLLSDYSLSPGNVYYETPRYPTREDLEKQIAPADSSYKKAEKESLPSLISSDSILYSLKEDNRKIVKDILMEVIKGETLQERLEIFAKQIAAQYEKLSKGGELFQIRKSPLVAKLVFGLTIDPKLDPDPKGQGAWDTSTAVLILAMLNYIKPADVVLAIGPGPYAVEGCVVSKENGMGITALEITEGYIQSGGITVRSNNAKVDIIHSNVYKPVDPSKVLPHRVDFITWSPPYVKSIEVQQRGYAKSPSDGGPDGMGLMRRALSELPSEYRNTKIILTMNERRHDWALLRNIIEERGFEIIEVFSIEGVPNKAMLMRYKGNINMPGPQDNGTAFSKCQTSI